MIYRISFQSPDVDGVIYHAASAAGFTGVLADVGTCGGEGIVLANQLHCVSVSALANQCNVTRNIHTGGTKCHAWYRIVQAAQTAMVRNMFFIVAAKSMQPHENQLGGVDSDGTVRGICDDLSRCFDSAQNTEVRFSVQYLTQHAGQLRQSDAAGDAFPAGLCLAQVQEIQCHIYRAQSGRAGRNAAFHIPVQLLNNFLSMPWYFYFQSTHRAYSFAKVCGLSAQFHGRDILLACVLCSE